MAEERHRETQLEHDLHELVVYVTHKYLANNLEIPTMQYVRTFLHGANLRRQFSNMLEQ